MKETPQPHAPRDWQMGGCAALGGVAFLFGAIALGAALLAHRWTGPSDPTRQRGLPDFVERWIENPAPEDTADRMLAAQEAMASAAWWMIAATLLGLATTVIATIAIYRQFGLMERATRAAERATTIADEHKRIETRAYIRIDHERTSELKAHRKFVVYFTIHAQLQQKTFPKRSVLFSVL